MRNYAEELSYWYLRFNGFFPLTDFVIHRASGRYPSDLDLLAIRTPYVQEDIGGHERDWDRTLLNCFDTDRTVGVICEVKAGRIDEELFREKYVRYSLKRFGFIPNMQDVEVAVSTLSDNKSADLGNLHQVFKLLISNKCPEGENPFSFISLQHTHDFLKQRIRNYKEKLSDWVYFSSSLLQELIWEVKSESDQDD